MRLIDEIRSRKYKTAASVEVIQTNQNIDKENRLKIMFEICKKLEDSGLDDYEYYRDCESVFAAIEHKHIDISDIISNDEYVEFKNQAIKEKLYCPCVGNQPKPKYDLNTEEGRMECLRNSKRQIMF